MEQHLYTEMASAERTHWWFTARRRVVKTLLETHVLPPVAGQTLQVLEVGCGTGGNAEILRPYGDLVGLEPNQDAHPHLHRGGYPAVAAFLPAPLPFAEHTFDMVCALDVLEHLPDDAASLAAIHALLKPGGVFIATVPAYGFLWSKHDDLNHHQRRYTQGSLRRVLKAAGFTEVYVSYYNTLLFPLIAGIRLISRVLDRQEQSDLAIPAGWLNGLLHRVFAAERFFVARKMKLPFGVSLMGVWHKIKE